MSNLNIQEPILNIESSVLNIQEEFNNLNIVQGDEVLSIITEDTPIHVLTAGIQGPSGVPGDKGDKGDIGGQGPEGLQGPSGLDGDKTYVHTQYIASDTWIINHGLNKFPAVVVIDSGGTEIIGDVNYIDINTVILYFTSIFGGKAFLN